DTLVMYTYGGDANLDGKIDIADYGQIDFNVPLGTSGWYNGDFNYDGKIDIADYGIIDFNIGIQGAPSSTAGPLGGFPTAAAAPPSAPRAAIPRERSPRSRRRRREPNFLSNHPPDIGDLSARRSRRPPARRPGRPARAAAMIAQTAPAAERRRPRVRRVCIL